MRKADLYPGFIKVQWLMDENGCLAIAHANLYIPSTIHGSNCDEMGAVDHDKLKKNLATPSDVYISRCDKTPFAGSQIHLFKGCNNDLSKKLQERRPLLLTFLTWSKKAKASPKEQHPLFYDYFTDVWG